MPEWIRRLMGGCLTVTAAAAAACAVRHVDHSLGDRASCTGWTLLAATAGLYLLAARKKWIQLRCGPVAVWLQVHCYLGSFACLVFLMHIGWPIRGVFESCLAAVFVFVSVSGIVLALLSRTTPRRLAALPTDYQLEQIPARQLSVAAEAHETALQSAGLGEGATLAEFYQRRLLPFFQTPRGPLYRLFPNGYRRRQLLRELNDLDRYLGPRGMESRRQMSAMIRSKDDLDYHHALQTRLRAWFTLHVAMTWSLALLVGVHVVLVLRFQGAL